LVPILFSKTNIRLDNIAKILHTNSQNEKNSLKTTLQIMYKDNNEKLKVK
jgi:hypothetical protein